MRAQQGDFSRPKQCSLIAQRLFLPWLCQQSMIPDFFPCRLFSCTCRGLAPGLLRKETWSKRKVPLWDQALVLVVLLQMGLSSPVHEQVSRTWPSRRQELLRPNTIQCGVGRGRSDTALLSILLLLSTKLYLTFLRSRFGWPITSLFLGSLQECTSPKTELTCRMGKDIDTCSGEHYRALGVPLDGTGR